MGKKIKFKPFIMKFAVDGAGHRMSVANADAAGMASAKMQEELQVHVQNAETKGEMVWSLAEFEDKLAMMKDALGAYEE